MRMITQRKVRSGFVSLSGQKMVVWWYPDLLIGQMYYVAPTGCIVQQIVGVVGWEEGWV